MSTAAIEHDVEVRAMGCAIRVLAGEPIDGTGASPEDATARVLAMI